MLCVYCSSWRPAAVLPSQVFSHTVLIDYWYSPRSITASVMLKQLCCTNLPFFYRLFPEAVSSGQRGSSVGPPAIIDLHAIDLCIIIVLFCGVFTVSHALVVVVVVVQYSLHQPSKLFLSPAIIIHKRWYYKDSSDKSQGDKDVTAVGLVYHGLHYVGLADLKSITAP